MRSVTFQTHDDITVTLEVRPRFEQLIREQFGISSDAPLSDADIKRFFIASMLKASK